MSLRAMGIEPAIGTTPSELPPVARELAAGASGAAGRGSGGSYRPHPRLPSLDHLNYLEKLATVALLLAGFLLLAGYSLRDPARALRLVVRGAEKRVGG
jgi:hypothetical protein